MANRQDTLKRRLIEPPFGTETSERQLMREAHDRIIELEDHVYYAMTRLSDVVAWKSSIELECPQLGGLLRAIYEGENIVLKWRETRNAEPPTDAQ